MASSSSNLRNPSSLPNLLLSFLNLTLFLLSSASLVPILVLRTPPTSFGSAIITTIVLTILSSSFGFCAYRSYCWFTSHIILVLTSMLCLTLGFFALFLREERSLDALGSVRGKNETKLLFRMEEFALLGIFVLQSLVLMLACVIQSWWVWEYKGFEVEKAEMARKRGRRMSRVQVEYCGNAAETEVKELDEKKHKDRQLTHANYSSKA